MTHLTLIRHARSTWNALGRMQGQADPPLDEIGQQQARALGDYLKSETIHAIYSSPLARARETAEAIAKHHSLAVRRDERLMERNLGKWTGLTGSEADEQYPEIRANGRAAWHTAGPPGGESLAQLTARAAAAMADILAAHPDDHVIVVSHGGTLNAYLARLLDLLPGSPIRFAIENTAIARFRIQSGRVLVLGLGDNRHLQAMRNL